MRDLKKRIEIEADTCNVGYNEDSNEILVEFTATGICNKVSYMYMNVEDVKKFIGLLNEAIKEVT